MVNRAMRVLVSMVWLVALVWLLGGEGSAPRLARFLRPDFWWLVVSGAAILGLFLLAALFHRHAGHDSPDGLSTHLVRMGILLVPLFYLPTAMVSRLGTHTFRKRSIVRRATPQATLAEPPTPAPKAPPAKAPEPAGDPEELTLVDLAESPEDHQGKRVVFLGMVHRDEELPAKIFVCFRFVIVCCAADATPAGVMVQHDTAAKLQPDQWVRVVGTVATATIGDEEQTVVNAERVEIIKEPDAPYLY